uniref:W2 domain-containing protein n=1 Tax=Aplanochytrium stocchinoi TaxID=215587 RepID=A0A7S3PKN1_9STRA
MDNEFSRGSRANEQRGFGDYGASEEAGAQWRRGPHAPQGGSVSGESEGERAGAQWRRGPTGGPGLRDRDNMPPRSDEGEVDQWRRAPPLPPSENVPSRADEERNWRRGPASSVVSSNEGGETTRQSDNDNNWRRGGATAVAAAGAAKPAEEVDSWRKAPPKAVVPIDSDVRPKLMLKKKGETDDTEKEQSTTETTGTQDGKDTSEEKKEGEESGERLDKWAKLEKEMEAKRKAAEKEKRDEQASGSALNGEFRRRMFGDNPRDNERENIFSSGFSKGYHRHDSNFPQRDNPGFAAFGSQNDRSGGGEFHQSQGRDDGVRNNLFGSSRGERDNNNLRDPRGAYNNPAFSSGRDRDRDREREMGDNRGADDRGAYSNPIFGGGRDRDRELRDEHRRDRDRDRDEPPAAMAASKPLDLNAVFKMGSVKNWAGDSDSDSEDKEQNSRPKLQLKEKTKIMTDEEIFSQVTIILKDFFLMQRPKETLAKVNEVFEGQKYQVEFIRKVIVSCYGQARAEVKAASSLLLKAKQDNMLKPQDISDAFEIVSTKLSKGLELEDKSDSKYKKAKENLDIVSQIYKMLDAKSGVNGVNFGECTLKILKIENKTVAKEAEEVDNAASEFDQAIEQLVSSGKKGSALVAQAQAQDISKAKKGAFGIAFIKKLLSTTGLCKGDQTASWVDKSNYGALLADCLYEEEPSAKQLENQVNALNEIQMAFNAVSFPRNAKGSSLLEKTFMELYKHEVIADEAYIAWKDVTDTPGKMNAIVQTSQFIAWLEEEEESEEESDEE